MATGLAEYEVLGRLDLKPGRYQLRMAASVGAVLPTVTWKERLTVSMPSLAATPRDVARIRSDATALRGALDVLSADDRAVIERPAGFLLAAADRALAPEPGRVGVVTPVPAVAIAPNPQTGAGRDAPASTSSGGTRGPGGAGTGGSSGPSPSSGPSQAAPSDSSGPGSSGSHEDGEATVTTLHDESSGPGPGTETHDGSGSDEEESDHGESGGDDGRSGHG